jgi:5,5'-dehydrodivanillate O-demethylase
VLSKEKNELLTRIGPHTPMGDLLRRYWHPVAGVSELLAEPVKTMRLFGEDLVLYRDLSGRYGLIDRHCPHRRADMSYGFVEQNGLRCSYHGWTVNEIGSVVAIPYDDIVKPQGKTKSLCRATAYPVRELAGMLWTYMGPAPAPELPVWEPFTRTNGFTEVVFSDVPCNWLQCQENSIDPVHFEWLHDNWPARMKGKTQSYAAKHLQVAFDEFEFGLTYRRLREGMKASDQMWTIGRVCLWPNAFCLGDHLEWRVPVDDENMLSVSWFYTRVPKESEPYVQQRIPAWHSPIRDLSGRWITSHVINQDIVGWIGQGRIADRTKEMLSASDKGIGMLRRRFFKDLKAIADGQDPSGLIRDPGRARSVVLPGANAQYHAPMSREEWLRHPFIGRRAHGNPWVAGQPDEVRREFLEAMGLSDGP